MVDILQKEINDIMKESEIKTFGFIVYNEGNPTIVKLLRDDDYWNALDNVSGEKFYIFAVKPKQGSMKIPSMPSGFMGMLMPVWDEPKDNEVLLDFFDIESTKNLPLFFVFTKVGPYLLKYSIKINESNIEEAFIQLKSLFLKINDITQKIHTEYHEHEAQVHDKIKEVLQKEKFVTVLKEVGSFVRNVSPYIGLVKRLL